MLCSFIIYHLSHKEISRFISKVGRMSVTIATLRFARDSDSGGRTLVAIHFFVFLQWLMKAYDFYWTIARRSTDEETGVLGSI